MSLRSLPFLLLFLCGCRGSGGPVGALGMPAGARAGSRGAPTSDLDVEHYRLELELFPQERRIEGRCTLRLFAVGDGARSLALHLEGLDVLEVTDDQDHALAFEQDGGLLRIEWTRATSAEEAITLTVRYAGSPAKGLWWTEDRRGEPLVFTHGECEESRWWFPCHDIPSDRATSELLVTMPGTWTSVAAGERVDSSMLPGSRRTDHWRMGTPHPVYLTTLVAGELESTTRDWHGMPLEFYAPPSWSILLDESLRETGPALDFFSELLARRYPYRKYAQACVPGFPFGGMENISATTLTVEALSDGAGLADQRPDDLVAHEVAHQWVGDLVTVADWSHVWVQEGLATYLTLMFLDHLNGRAAFLKEMRDKRLEYLRGDQGPGRRPIVHDVYRSPSDLFAGAYAYQGGATRFHLLRSVLGEAGFRSGLRLLVGRSAGGSVTTDDVRAAFEEASGQDLEAFFQQWLLQPGHPEIETHWRYDESRGQVILSINQVQSVEGGVASAFQAPVDVEIMGAEGPVVTRIALEKRRAKVELPCDGPPMWVRFDKERWLPAEIREDKQTSEWLAILLLDDDLNGRLDALEALARTRAEAEADVRVAIEQAFMQSLSSDPVAAVRAAAAAEVSRLGTAAARAALEAAARGDVAVAVRQAALEGLVPWGPDDELARLAERAFDGRASWATMGAAATLRVAAAPETAFAWIRERLRESTPNEILRRHLLSALGGLPTPEATDELRRVLRAEDTFAEVRGEAARQLVRRAMGEDRSAAEVRADLIAALDTRDGRFRRTLLDAVALLPHDDVREALVGYYERTVHDRERRVIEAALIGDARP